MTSASNVIAAFQSASGITAVSTHDALTFVLAGLALTWLAWAVFGIGTRVLDGRMPTGDATWYVARALVISMLIVFVLIR